MAATLTDPLLGHVIDGRYEVLSRIARGGMATVYLANDRRLDREVAVKVMHPHLAEGSSGADFVARFRREARAAARLTHPGLVGVLDQGVDGDVSYLIMEYVPGPTLRRHLEESGALPLGEALAITESVLDALAAAHRTGLVHRDIKPENVLIGPDGRIRITDFGLARAVTEVTTTTTGTVFGTVGYLAPELVAHGVSDARTDVYAAGVMLYEMLTGSQPFRGATPIQVAYQHVNSELPAVSDTLSWLPSEIDELIAGLSARDPQERPLDGAGALALLRTIHEELDPELLARRADVAGAPSGPDDATVRLADLGVELGPEGQPLSRTVALRIGTGLAEAPADPVRRRRWPRVVAWLVGLALLVGGGAVAAHWFLTEGPGAFTTVPTTLVGHEQAAAEAFLDGAGLAHDVTEAFDPEVRAGLVLSADPTEGSSVRKDGTVHLVVSQGPDLREVPVIIPTMPFEEAQALLVAAGFTVPEPESRFDDDIPAGHVVTVDTQGGIMLPVGTAVTMTVSDGPAPQTVAAVIGAPTAEARASLEELGFQVEVAEGQFSEAFAEGLVMAQDPAGGTDGHRRDVITLTPSLGPPWVEVPDVMQRDHEEARAILEAAGLQVEISRAWFWDTMVVRQIPEAGEQVRKGSTVELRLN